MARQKKTRETPKKHRQTKLTGGVESSNHPKSKSSPTKRKRPTYSPGPNALSDDSDVGAIRLEPKKSDDDEEKLPSPAKRRRKTLLVASDAEESDEIQEIAVVKRKTRSATKKGSGTIGKAQDTKGNVQAKKKGKEPVKAKGKRKKSQAASESDSEVEESPQPRRRKLVKGNRPAPKSDTEESDEIEPERIIESRFRSRNRKTEYQKNLERLKRKKRGKPMDSEDEDEEDEEEEAVAPFKGAAPESERDSLFDGSDSESESFIVEDDGPGLATLPVEFSMDTHQDLAHHFKTIFQFFVHIAVRPSLERHDFMEQQMKTEEYFSVPLTVARRKILGLRDSLVASSVWRPEFKGPLEKYPELDLTQLDFAVPGCDACHLGARMSTQIGRLLGQPYDRLGFEDLDLSDDESDEPDVKENGVQAEYHLGRFCARRTRVYHDLSHWEYMLFKTISDEVDDLHISEQEKGAGRFVRVAWAEGRKPPEDLHDADGICDWLDQRKVIEVEWQKLKGVMERARGLDAVAKKDDDDMD